MEEEMRVSGNGALRGRALKINFKIQMAEQSETVKRKRKKQRIVEKESGMLNGKEMEEEMIVSRKGSLRGRELKINLKRQMERQTETVERKRKPGKGCGKGVNMVKKIKKYRKETDGKGMEKTD